MKWHLIGKSLKKEIQLMMKPWITKEILEKCNRRDSLLKNISVENDNGKLTILHNAYKKLRNEITKDKRESKKVYFTVYFERNKNKSAAVWKGIKSLVNIKSTKSSIIKLLDENKNIVTPKKLLICLTNISPLLVPKLNKKFLIKLVISKII